MNREQAILTLGLDSKPLVTGLQSINQHFKEAGASIKSTVVGWLGGFAAMGTITAGMNHIRNVVEDLADLSEVTGTSANFLQSWQRIIINGTGSLQDANQSITKFTTLLGDSARDSALAEKNFGRFGISIRATDGSLRSSMDVLGDVAELIKDTGTQAEKASIAAELFGQRMGPRLVAALAEGRKAIEQMQEASVFKISDSNLDELKMHLDSLKGKAEGLTGVIGNIIAKQLKSAGGAFRALGAISILDAGTSLTGPEQILEVIRAIAGVQEQVRAAGRKVKIISPEELAVLESAEKALQGLQKTARDISFKNAASEEKVNILIKERNELWQKFLKTIAGTEEHYKTQQEYLLKEQEIREGISKEKSKEAQSQEKIAAASKRQAENEQKTLDAATKLADAKQALTDAKEDRSKLTMDQLVNDVSWGGPLDWDKRKATRATDLETRADKLKLTGDFAGSQKLLEERDQIVVGNTGPEAIKMRARIDRMRRETTTPLSPNGNVTAIARMEDEFSGKFDGIRSLQKSFRTDPFDSQKKEVSKLEEALKAGAIPVSIITWPDDDE